MESFSPRSNSSEEFQHVLRGLSGLGAMAASVFVKPRARQKGMDRLRVKSLAYLDYIDGK